MTLWLAEPLIWDHSPEWIVLPWLYKGNEPSAFEHKFFNINFLTMISDDLVAMDLIFFYTWISNTHVFLVNGDGCSISFNSYNWVCKFWKLKEFSKVNQLKVSHELKKGWSWNVPVIYPYKTSHILIQVTRFDLSVPSYEL